MHDSSTCEVCRGLPIQGSLSDDEFLAFLASCRKELAAKQEIFEHRIQAASRWFYDMADLTLARRSPLRHHPNRYTQRDQPFLVVAWANEDLPAVACTASRRIQALHAVTGFRVFTDPGIPASSLDAQAFTASAVHILDAIGFFRCPSGGPVLYLAVHEVDRTLRS
jgi:hypothetical protein